MSSKSAFTQDDVTKLPVGRWSFGDGLVLEVRGETSRAWVYRYMFKGVTRNKGLGSASTITLKAARVERDRLKGIKATGIDPLLEERKAEAEAAVAEATLITFKQAGLRYIDEVAARKWSNARYSDWVKKLFDTVAFPVFGHLPVLQVNRALVIQALRPIWHAKPKTARLVLQHVYKTFEFVFAHDETITMRNPAMLAPIVIALGEQNLKVVSHAAVEHKDIAGFLSDLHQRPDATGARCLEFAILTAARSNEVMGTEWIEIDFQAKTWTVPPERMKNRQEHVVPLSDRAIEILRKQERCRVSKYVFPGYRGRATLSHTALLQLMRRISGANSGNLTVHGFRATFKTWAEEETAFDSKLIEKALSHTIFVGSDGLRHGDKTQTTYHRGAWLEKRRKLMQAWADYCSAPPARPATNDDNVVSFPAATAA